MLFNTVVVATLGFFILQAHAGSRLWESSKTLVGRGLHRRAISFQPSGGERGHYTWPDKKLRYCFADANARSKLRAPFTQASLTTWGALIDLGFSYEEEENLDKCNKDRINYLMIYYNDQGKFSCTPGKQPVDEEYNRENPDNIILGPTMHLSDKENVGMLDIVANVAHEIGHAWGLYHEHQNPKLWQTSFSDTSPADPNAPIWFPIPGSQNPVFQPDQFHCTALADYPDALARAKELSAQGGQYEGIDRTFCTVRSHAAKVKFTAKEWLPLSGGVPIIADDEFDPDSIMLYPSGAGGNSGANTPDTRADVLTLANGVRMEPNVVPSERDVERLRVLYTTNIADIQELHIRGAKKGLFDKIKKGLKKHGSAKDKAC